MVVTPAVASEDCKIPSTATREATSAQTITEVPVVKIVLIDAVVVSEETTHC